VTGDDDLRSLDPGGLEVLDADLDHFSAVLQSANHTLKRALTDPQMFSGIGNAYSDEILWEARLSNRRPVPGESHSISRANGGPWQVQTEVSPVR
jgi:formamidopyrimidine-DNA glycosylase